MAFQMSKLKSVSLGNDFSLFEKQRKYMFNVYITVPFISLINQFMPFGNQFSTLFTYSAVSTSIPGKDRTFEIKRFMGETYTLPEADDFDHTWDCVLRFSELGFEHDFLRFWFNYIKAVDNIDDAKGTAKIELVRLDGQVVNRSFDILGLYPTSIPEIKDLNHDEKTGLVMLDTAWAFDSIKYGSAETIFDTISGILSALPS